MKYFISGGAGFIGSNLGKHLLGRVDTKSVIVYDNLKSGSLALIEEMAADIRTEFIQGDIHDRAKLSAAMSGCDTLIHLAANPDISRAETDPELDFREGTILTQNCLEAARKVGISKIIFTSGSGVYGEHPQQIFSEDWGPCLPISPYGAAKLGSEALISAYCHMFKIQGCALRFANVVGPNQTHGVGYDFVRKLQADPTTLKILGDGTQTKSYIFISDILSAIDLMIGEAVFSAPFDVFNVATQDYISVAEIAQIACKALGLDPNKVTFNYTGGDRGWNGDVPRVRFDTTKIRNLGWRNEFNSLQALEKSIKAMAQN